HRLFGTDGVRGKAGEYPLDHETVARIGGALGPAMRSSSDPSRPLRFVVGRDTRESGEWIERELARGVHSAGAEITSAGVIPTPAIAFGTRGRGLHAGWVISASHNPFEDNGIKVFSGAGEKFTETLEREVESIVADSSWSVPDPAAGPVEEIDLRSEYLDHLHQILPRAHRTEGMRIAIDCANGATAAVAPRLFGEMGFEVTCIGAAPDGRNINLGCGSTAPDILARLLGAGQHA